MLMEGESDAGLPTDMVACINIVSMISMHSM